MVIGSHNSWTYLKPKYFLCRFLNFTCKCQSKDIYEQYEYYNVKAFDLRVRFDKYGQLIICHNLLDYIYDLDHLWEDLHYLNSMHDVSIKVTLDVRYKKRYNEKNIDCFKRFCEKLELSFEHIKFFGGDNLYNGENIYDFKYKPDCVGCFASSKTPYIDDLWPWLFSKLYNKKIKKDGSDKDILFIDFVNI